jgi:hypothetical protein
MFSFLTKLILLSSCFDILGALGDVGTATYYDPPYLRKYKQHTILIIDISVLKMKFSMK